MKGDTQTTGGENYEVYALRYASRPGRKSREFYGFEKYGEPDADYPVDYFFWLARSTSRTVLVDCGYHRSRGQQRGMFASHVNQVAPERLLHQVDVDVNDVDHVVLSHLHLDHVGNVDLFPNATFSMARRELEFWQGPCGSRRLLAHVVHPTEIVIAAELARAGRLRLVEDAEEIAPGITVTRVGGHTPGQLITDVAGTSQRVVLASDAVHFYEEFEADRPFWLFSDITETYRTLARMRELAARPGVSVVPGHDPRVRVRFATSRDNNVTDLNRPVRTTGNPASSASPGATSDDTQARRTSDLAR